MKNDAALEHFRGFLFDIDGTLIDSNDAHTRAWIDVLAGEGIPVAYETVRHLIGMGGDKVLPILARIDAESERGKAIGARRGKVFREKYLPGVEPFAQVRELFLTLQRLDRKFAIATSASDEDMSQLLKKCKIEDLIGAKKTSSADAEHSKPDPDILQAAIVRIGMKPEHLAMVGDTPYDLEAARKAKVTPIAFRCGGYWPDAAFSEATRIFAGPAELLASLA